MPFALSEIGPKESIATLLPVSVSMPIPVIATPYRMKVARSAPETPGMVPKIKMEAMIVKAMTSTDHTEDSNPTETPFKINVAGPVSADFLMSLTGAACVPVKYSVKRSIKMASTTPTPTAMGKRHQPPHSAISEVFKYRKPAIKNSAAEITAEVKKPLKIALIASVALPVAPARTKYVPMMDESTPIPRTIKGKMIHSSRPVMCQSAKPRIKPETMVTS